MAYLVQNCGRLRAHKICQEMEELKYIVVLHTYCWSVRIYSTDQVTRQVLLHHSTRQLFPLVFFQDYLCDRICEMSLQQVSQCLVRPSTFGCLVARSVSVPMRSSQSLLRTSRYRHNASTRQLVTTSVAYYRPSLRPSRHSARLTGVNNGLLGSTRSIFIQTETTPNPDVSKTHFSFP